MKCWTCKKENTIVNECGCDPNNLPTRPRADAPLNSPLPWTFIEPSCELADAKFRAISNSGGCCSPSMLSYDGRLIVRSVNSHDMMVSALKSVLESHGCHPCAVCQSARAALAVATK